MSIVERSVSLAENRDRVFTFVSDPDNFAAYVAGYTAGRVTSERPTGVGSAFEWTSRIGPISLHAREEVSEWQAPGSVAYAGRFAGVGFRSRIGLSERSDGGTDLCVTVDYDLPPKHGGQLGDAFVRRLVERDMKRSLHVLETRFGLAYDDDTPSHDEVVEIYRKRASAYDTTSRLYGALGFRLSAYRRLAVDALELRRGDTVVEIGCGTGENFELLRERVGAEGCVIGVDLTDAMLAEAERKVRARGWQNVRLVHSDAVDYVFPDDVRGILSTLALTLSPDYDAVVRHGAAALGAGGRWVLLDLKHPRAWPLWMVRTGMALCGPFGVTMGATSRHPWESLEQYLPHTRMTDLYFGIAYLAVGWRGAAA